MKLTIGVLGSTTGSGDEATRDKLVRLGRTIAERGHALITAARPGLQHTIVQGAREAGGSVLGVSPAWSRLEHVERYGWPTEGFDPLIFTGAGPTGRDIEIIHSSDIVIIAGARSGPADELAIAYDEGRPIGVLTRTRGVADAVEELVRVCGKPTGAVVVCDDDPIRLVDRLVAHYQAECDTHPSWFRGPTAVSPVAGSTNAARARVQPPDGCPEWGACLLPHEQARPTDQDGDDPATAGVGPTGDVALVGSRA